MNIRQRLAEIEAMPPHERVVYEAECELAHATLRLAVETRDQRRRSRIARAAGLSLEEAEDLGL
jgi:hypothetical protein